MINKKGSSLIEVVVVVIILTIGIVGSYSMLFSGQKLANTTENRIKAINIAREGIEAVQNIRDTNWIKFSSDIENCWNTLNNNASCIGNPGSANKIHSGSYIITQSGSLWKLEPKSIGGTYTSDLTNFPIGYDINGLITQTGSTTKCTSTKTASCQSIFTREIRISYPDTNDPATSKKMEVHSIVTWQDNSKNGKYTIDLKTVLTNRKKGF